MQVDLNQIIAIAPSIESDFFIHNNADTDGDNRDVDIVGHKDGSKMTLKMRTRMKARELHERWAHL